VKPEDPEHLEACKAPSNIPATAGSKVFVDGRLLGMVLDPSVLRMDERDLAWVIAGAAAEEVGGVADARLCLISTLLACAIGAG
jgi:hypothetical protein